MLCNLRHRDILRMRHVVSTPSISCKTHLGANWPCNIYCMTIVFWQENTEVNVAKRIVVRCYNGLEMRAEILSKVILQFA